ncbi:hypothetical protein WDH52_17350 [Streptomyces sp. TRM70308]|uniref:hypothetical protein n=1 Tax=Streptomyces sp. TRM70308 TaxID=3131932 RepID=UPI003D079F03
MNTAPVSPTTGGPGGGGPQPGTERPPGATAASPGHAHPRHRLGNALRAARVFAEAAFEVAVLGDPAATPTTHRRAA